MINSINSLFCYLNLDPKPGQGPSKLEALEEITEEDEMNFESIHNIDEWGTESALTMREALKTWNMTVQWWLVANVYRQLPGKVLCKKTIKIRLKILFYNKLLNLVQT